MSSLMIHHSNLVDLRGCEAIEFATPVDRHYPPQEWPRDVADLLGAALRRWREDNPAAAVRALTYTCEHFGNGFCCVLVNHYQRSAPAPSGGAGGRRSVPSSDASAFPTSMPAGAVAINGQSGHAARSSHCQECG